MCYIWKAIQLYGKMSLHFSFFNAEVLYFVMDINDFLILCIKWSSLNLLTIWEWLIFYHPHYIGSNATRYCNCFCFFENLLTLKKTIIYQFYFLEELCTYIIQRISEYINGYTYILLLLFIHFFLPVLRCKIFEYSVLLMSDF